MENVIKFSKGCYANLKEGSEAVSNIDGNFVAKVILVSGSKLVQFKSRKEVQDFIEKYAMRIGDKDRVCLELYHNKRVVPYWCNIGLDALLEMKFLVSNRGVFVELEVEELDLSEASVF